MKRIAFSALLLALPMAALGHHSRAGYDMSSVQEFEAELLDVTWRNPHIAFRVRITNDQGAQEDWTAEGWGSLYTLERTGVSEEDFRVGDRVRLAGFVSTREERDLLSTHMLLADGTEAILQADAEPRWADQSIGGQARWAMDQSERPDAAAENLGIFRVWSPSGYASINTTTLHTPFTEAAVASRETWDTHDNYITRCEPGGMPLAMMMPHPYSFEDRGAEVLLHGQVWDLTRTIFMESSGREVRPPNPALGLSFGRWEGRTLIVETRDIDFPYFDWLGTTQSDAMEIIEEYALSEDQSRLDYRMTITDPETFTEPATMETYWLALGEPFDPFDCQVN